MHMKHLSAPQPPQPPHRLRQVCKLWVFPLCRDFMAESSGQPTGAARRRRERRLRSMLRHEQQTVRMALAAALHHSAGPKEKVEMQQNGALRGQKTAARAGEEVCSTRTTPYGDRRHHLRGCGPAVSVARGRRGATAPCGAPQGDFLFSLLRCWQTLLPRQWTPSLSGTSSSKRIFAWRMRLCVENNNNNYNNCNNSSFGSCVTFSLS